MKNVSVKTMLGLNVRIMELFKMTKRLWALSLSFAFFCQHASAQDWHVTAFGQSTDLNFASLIAPSKIGRNNVWIAGNNHFLQPNQSYELPVNFFIESRGGKIANSHDGMTVFYTTLNANQTFILEADLTLQQLGPEVDGKSPAAQEAAGLFVRDIIGTPRQEPQSLGFEEFPQASNLLMNAFITQNKKNDNLVQITSIVREGVQNSWGNEDITIKKIPIVKNVDYTKNTLQHFTIERTDKQFILTVADTLNGNKKTWYFDDYSGFMNQQDSKKLSVGFFASRNAKLEVKNAMLKVGNELVDYSALSNKKNTSNKAHKPTLLLASPSKVASDDTVLQFAVNQNGSIALSETNETKNVKAGDLIEFPVKLNNGVNNFTVTYRTEGIKNTQTVIIDSVKSPITNLSKIYVCNDCKSNALGTEADPVDLITAVELVSPGGQILLNDGYYKGITLAKTLSGLKGKAKTIQAINQHKAIFIDDTFNLDADYWHIKDVIFDGNINNTDNKPAYLRVSGSYNIIERVIARNNDDTGIAISAKNRDRQFWPSHNLVLNSDSYNNLDLSGINADGFAAKLGVGPGNIFKGCISHHNADDGWDLFNKIEDGPNEPVLIENSVSYANGLPFKKQGVSKRSIGNGFKLGGEGQPVNHKIINSIAFNNNMDGFTDNFNTGSLIIANNIALNNARYNYILRSNPYSIPSSITFNNNYSIRDSWDDEIKDYLGEQVNIINYKVISSKDISNMPQEIKISRDEKGNIIYPDVFTKLNPDIDYN